MITFVNCFLTGNLYGSLVAPVVFPAEGIFFFGLFGQKVLVFEYK